MKSVLLINENRGFGGAEVHTLQLAQGLGLHRRTVLVAPPDSWLAEQAAGKAFEFVPLAMRSEMDPVAVARLNGLYRKFEVGLVHSMANRDLVLATLARPPALLKAEHSYLDPHRSKLFDWAYRRAEARVVVSKALARQVGPQLNLTEDAFEVIPNGQPAARFENVEPHPQLDSREWIGTVSALRKEKGQADLLAAFAELQAEFPNLGLVFAGEGPLRQELQEQAGDLPVLFLGQVEKPESVLAGLKVSVVPSHRETFSLVCLESMALEKPLIASNTGGIPEVVGETAWLYEAGHREQLKERLLECLKDPDQARRKAGLARARFLEQFTEERMLERYLKVYEPYL